MDTYISPIYNVVGIPIEDVVANDYNPNSVASPEFELLYQSILADGYTSPVIVTEKNEDGKHVIVDGFHRATIMRTKQDIRERENGLLPCVILNKSREDRIASTIRMNRARGSHSVEIMRDIVGELVESGMSDQWIKKNIGMSQDELTRFKQISGIASLFKDVEFSKAWELDTNG